MADFNLKDDLLGFGRSQLKYLLFHNTTLADLTDFTHKKGLFFYDTDNNSLEVLHDDTDKWRTTLNIVSFNDPLYSSNDGLSGRVLVGTSEYGTVSGYNPITAGFLKTDIDGILSNQRYITFEDIEPTDYTTTISAPGVNTRFATEKAIVDYVGTLLVTHEDNLLHWNGTAYAAFSAKKGSTPGYAYFYSGVSNPTFTNRLNIDGNLYATSFRSAISGTQSRSILANQNAFFISYADATYSYGLNISAETWGGYITNFNYNNNGCGPIVIGDKSGSGAKNLESITIDDFNQLFNIDMTTVRLNKGTANKYLYLDASKNITYVDAPAGGVTPVDNILDWDTDAYKPYTAKTASVFYTGVTVPDAIATILNYDGIFRATQLFEGNTRVMTTHGNWTANGSLHAVTTTSHAGFCPKLPLVGSTTTFLRADGTWVSPESYGYWDRSGTVLSPINANDILSIESNSSSQTAYFSNSGSTGVALIAKSSNDNVSASFWTYHSTDNSLTSVLKLYRLVQAGANGDNNIGGSIDFHIMNASGTASATSGYLGVILEDALGASLDSSMVFGLRSAGAAVTEVMRLKGTGELITINQKITGLATYADNTAATGGGLTTGQLYKTASGTVMIVY